LLDPERIVKSKKSSKKGASGSGKPKNSDLSLKNEFIVEESQLESWSPALLIKKFLQRLVQPLVQLVPL